MKRVLFLFLAIMLLTCPVVRAAESDLDVTDGDTVYTLLDEAGNKITSRAGRIYEGDEYISSDNKLYLVMSVDDKTYTAKAVMTGDEPPVNQDKVTEVFASAEQKKKLICMYSTHSDESYEPTDGASSKTENAGIYDVDRALKEQLEKMGIKVILSDASHLPHDAKAYSRSRRTAAKLLKESPDALLDIHRDGIPDESEYETRVNGEDTSKVRLLVGRSNPNADANREFAKEIKSTADEKYPGLIKDIFIGKGNYNQELYPQAILLEFGTHTLDKDLAINSTSHMAEVLNDVLYGGTAQAAPAESTQEENKAGGTGIIWLVVVVAIAAIIYALIATGTFRGMWDKLARGTSEMTGGAIGKKPDDRKKK